MRISVGPPYLTINHGTTFMVTDLGGQIASDTYLGLFCDDTRFLSYYACYIDGHPWTRLTSTTTAYYAARVYLTNPAFRFEDGEVEQGTISLVISRTVEKGIHEDLDLTNHGLTPVNFSLEIALRSDFADIFEVTSGRIVRRGRLETRWDDAANALHTAYQHQDFYRRLTYQLRDFPAAPHYANGRVTFDISLGPGETWHTCGNYILVTGERIHKPVHLCYEPAVDNQINTELEELHAQWLGCVTRLDTTHEDLLRLYEQSVQDLGALRLYDYDLAPHVWLPAAGVPKFVTLFGRDSLVVSLQNMMVHPGFAKGALQKLAQLQATEVDDWRDAQPGKILHEIRQGELAHFHQVPHTPYYGTADATPLYLITLHETWKWLGEEDLLRDYRQVAHRCLDWIDRYSDLDGDGLQEYQTRSADGIENQSWKDSGDAIVYPDGSQVEAPKALCELQGYVFDAWLRMAEIFEVLGEGNEATALRDKAAALQARFEEQFWCEDLGYYALTLDPDKQPVKTIASNIGHCLWSGIVNPNRAAQVVERLLQPQMNCGWGIRTLSTENPAFNPFSYHRGSVWPHDNGLIALGMKRYGFAAEAGQIAQSIFEAASFFANYRLPELYAGTARRPGTFPVPYIEANVPQAWAAGSVFHLLQAVLGLQADAPRQRLYLDPCLPDWLPDLTLRQLQVGQAWVDLRFWRQGDQTCWDATLQKGTLDIQVKPWQPWFTSTASQPLG